MARTYKLLGFLILIGFGLLIGGSPSVANGQSATSVPTSDVPTLAPNIA